MNTNKKIRLTKENASDYIGKNIEFLSNNIINKRELVGVGGGENSCYLKVDFPSLNNNLVIWRNNKSSRVVYVDK